MRDQSSAPPDGIVVASGFGLKIHVDRGHLVVHDGVGRDRHTIRLSRATGGLERLVVVGHTGFITLEALRWIRDVGASFAQIGRDGELIAISSAERFHKTKLRRAQATGAGSVLGLRAMKVLAMAKLEQQAVRVAQFPELWPSKPNGGRGQVEVGRVLRTELDKVATCATLEALRASESVAGRWYWQTLANLPVQFETSWRKTVPEHWHKAGARTSPPSGYKSSRKAATPFHAIINYAYAILETEATIVLQAHGFDPSLGILHTDKRYGDSLAHDLMEPARPVVDGLVIELVAKQPLQRGDVFETREGVCRLGPALARQLARLAPVLWPALDEHARSLASLLLGAGDASITRPARRRSPTTAGKGGKRRGTGRARA